jgi:hypothetical protein
LVTRTRRRRATRILRMEVLQARAQRPRKGMTAILGTRILSGLRPDWSLWLALPKRARLARRRLVRLLLPPDRAPMPAPMVSVNSRLRRRKLKLPFKTTRLMLRVTVLALHQLRPPSLTRNTATTQLELSRSVIKAFWGAFWALRLY